MFEDAISHYDATEPTGGPAAAVAGELIVRPAMHRYWLNRLEQAKSLCAVIPRAREIEE